MKYVRFLRENSPCVTFELSCLWMNSIPPSDSVLRISAVANCPEHRKMSSFATDLISSLSEMHERSRMIFWKSVEGRLMIEEKETLGKSSTSSSGSMSRRCWVLNCLISEFSNLKLRCCTIPSS